MPKNNTAPAKNCQIPSITGEVFAKTDTKEGHLQKLATYASAKKHSLSVANYLEEHETLFKEHEQLRYCGSLLVFRHFFPYLTLPAQYKLIGGCSCKMHLLCALCALRRSAKLVRIYEEKLKTVLSENQKLIPVLLTLTIKNGSDLKERTEHLAKSYLKMIESRRRAKNGSRDKTAFSHIAGGFGGIEVKLGVGSGLWHPHMHLLCLVDSSLDLSSFAQQISLEWKKITKDSHNIDLRKIDNSTNESLLKSICEVSRYVLKYSEMEISDQVHAFKILRTSRLIRSFGLLHGVKAPDNLHDTIDETERPYIDLMYRYSVNQGYLLHKTIDTGETFTGSKKSKKQPSPRKFNLLVTQHALDFDYIKKWLEKQPASAFQPDKIPF